MALQNLIDNAFKYSNELGHLCAKQIDGKVIQELKIRYWDCRRRERKFMINSTALKVEILGIKGYGLGLSLVKSIVETMSGRIEIEDNKPQDGLHHYFSSVE